MQVEHSNQRDLTPEEHVHLAKLRTLVQDCLADGKLSETEISSIRALIHADHKVTLEELQTIRATIHDALGNAFLEYDWS